MESQDPEEEIRQETAEETAGQGQPIETPAEPAAPSTDHEPEARSDLMIPEPEMPAAEAPVEELPATESPVDETPAAETPAVEMTEGKALEPDAPAAETPVEETPAAEAPAAEMIEPQMPEAETPAAETPVEETPAVEAPAAEMVEPEMPEAEPAAETPVEETPAAGAPAPEAPEVESPVEEPPAPVATRMIPSGVPSRRPSKTAPRPAPEPPSEVPVPIEGPAWFVIHCYSGYENKVRHNLEQRIETMGMKDKIFDVVIPTQEEIEVKDGKRRTVERHIFPGYVLVNMVLSEESWYVVRNTPGVTGFVGMGTQPTPLRPEEVAQIVKRMEAEAPTVKVTYKVGERVRIVDGPFNDFRGVVAEIDMERTKVRVMVSFFGRETPVELDFLQVEKA